MYSTYHLRQCLSKYPLHHPPFIRCPLPPCETEKPSQEFSILVCTESNLIIELNRTECSLDYYTQTMARLNQTGDEYEGVDDGGRRMRNTVRLVMHSFKDKVKFHWSFVRHSFTTLATNLIPLAFYFFFCYMACQPTHCSASTTIGSSCRIP